MAPRKNVPGSRTIATIDSNPVKHFKQLQDAGVIPKKFSSWEDVDSEALHLYSLGKNDQEVAQELGITQRNVIQNRYIQLNESSGGKFRGINKRAIREDIKPDELRYIQDRYGPEFLSDVQRLRELEWGDKKPRKGEDVEALKERIYSAMDNGLYQRSEYAPSFESAKTTADRAKDRLRLAFGKNPGQARESQVHRGHGRSALEGAGVGSSNLEAEWGPGNVSHGADPRFDRAVMKALNMSSGDLQALYDGYLTNRGLDINPQRYSGNYIAADESLRELKQGTRIGNPTSTIPTQQTSVSQSSIEWRDRRLEEVARQRAVDIEKSGVPQADALAQARNEMRTRSFEQSTLFDTTQTVGGPVRSVKPPEGAVLVPRKPGLSLTNGSIRFKVPTIGKALGVVGAVATVVSAAEKAMAGDLSGAGGDLVDAGLDQVYMAPAAVADSTLQGVRPDRYLDVMAKRREKERAGVVDFYSMVANMYNTAATGTLKPAAPTAKQRTTQALLSRVPTPVATNKPPKPKPKPAAKPINPLNEALYIGNSLSRGKLPYSN